MLIFVFKKQDSNRHKVLSAKIYFDCVDSSVAISVAESKPSIFGWSRAKLICRLQFLLFDCKVVTVKTISTQKYSTI